MITNNALLGREYLIGRYVTQDSAEAMVWFERSASAGSSAGANAMGVMYYEALGIEQDYEMVIYSPLVVSLENQPKI